MKKTVQVIAMAATTLLLTACVSEKHYTKAINSWHGAPEVALTHQWGEPTDVTELKNGNHLDVYRVQRKAPYPTIYANDNGITSRLTPQPNATAMLSKPSTMRRNNEADFWCETAFEVNKAGVIVNTHFEGNDCDTTLPGSNKRAFATAGEK